MMWLYVIAVAVLGVIVVLLVGRWDGAQPPKEEPPAGGPHPVATLLAERGEQGVRAEDLERVELATAVRGYRMDQVDALLDALAQQLRRAESSAEDTEPRERRDISPE